MDRRHEMPWLFQVRGGANLYFVGCVYNPENPVTARPLKNPSTQQADGDDGDALVASRYRAV